jgi:hypothetical protein
MRSSGVLRSVEWQFRVDVSVQPIGPIFKDQSITLEDETDRLLQNIGEELPLCGV